MTDITQIGDVGGDSETTYRNIIAFTTKKYKKRDLNMGDPVVLWYRRLRIFKPKHAAVS